MCAGYAYGTVANLELVGLPRCACGSTLQPTELDLALLLDATESRPMIAYMRECNSVARGQRGPGMRASQSGRALRRSPEEIAAERVERERVSHAVWRQISALKPLPTPEPMAF